MTARKKLAEPILAEGEVTGHAHRLEGDVAVFEEGDGTRTFDVEEPTDLTHEEHETQTLRPQKWASGRVREFDHPEEEAREVRD